MEPLPLMWKFEHGTLTLDFRDWTVSMAVYLDIVDTVNNAFVGSQATSQNIIAAAEMTIGLLKEHLQRGEAAFHGNSENLYGIANAAY